MMIYDYATARIAELEAELDLLRKRVDDLESEKRAARDTDPAAPPPPATRLDEDEYP